MSLKCLNRHTSRWKLWLRDFETFLLVSGITEKKCQRALLLYQAGPQVRENFAQLSMLGAKMILRWRRKS